MIAALLLEDLDLPTRRTQEPELGVGDLGLVDHQRVELMQGLTLPGWLDDDQAAVIAQAAPTALAVEERDQPKPLALVPVSLGRASSRGVVRPLSCAVSALPSRRKSLWLAHPSDSSKSKFRMALV